MTDTLRRATLTAVTGLGLCLTLLPAGQAFAQSPTTRVPCNDIPALKAAITKANTSGGRITLASRCTYTLTAPDNADDGLPEITGNVTLTGDRTTIRRAPDATQDFRVLHVVSGGTLTLNSLGISGGSLADDNGGGVANEDGTLNLNRTMVRGNHAEMGGGLYNTGGKLNLDRSTAERNSTDAWGAGVFNTGGGTMKMTGGSLRDNRALNNGGGLENISGTAYLHHVSVRGNTALEGGGIRQTIGATLRLRSTEVRDNIAVSGGGMSNNGSTATLVQSLVTRNTAITTGGGIINEADGQVTLTDSRVVRNRPDNCVPQGTIAGCSDPAGRTVPPAAKLPPATDTKALR